MRKLLLGLTILAVCALPVYASSAQTYQDYLHQYDTYRQTTADFQTAKNEYLQFQSLSSQTAALDKTKLFLTQRDALMKSYLLLLSDKLDENSGVSSADKNRYQQILANESAFLTHDAQQIPNASSLDSVITLSPPFEQHYKTLHQNIEKVLIALALGQLTTLDTSYQSVMNMAQSIVTANKNVFPSEKQATIAQWMDQIQKKQQAYQQQYATLTDTNNALDGFDVDELDQKYNKLLQGITDTRQYLIDGASYIGELKNSLKYMD